MGRFLFRSSVRSAARMPTATAAAVVIVLSLSASSSGGLLLAEAAEGKAAGADDGAYGGGGGGEEFGSFAGYRPTADVTNWALLDRDQRSLESQLKLRTADGFAAAASIYYRGGHSFPYATLRIDPPLIKGEGVTYERGDAVWGLITAADAGATSAKEGGEGEEKKKVHGTLAGEYYGGERTIDVLYGSPEDVDGEIRRRGKALCMVGGLKGTGEELTEGCYNETGTLHIRGHAYTYKYDARKDTHAKVTLSILSSRAASEMLHRNNETSDDDCLGCPYPEFVQYFSYYHDASYGHRYVRAALEGTDASYPRGRGDADFTDASPSSPDDGGRSDANKKGRVEGVRKGTTYLSVFMYVLRHMRRAVAECDRPCRPDCDPSSDRECVACDGRAATASEAWDAAAALYVGSLEGRTPDDDDDIRSPAGEEEDEAQKRGEFLYDLAESRCRDFRTCGPAGDSSGGTSAVNRRIMRAFADGQRRLLSGKCRRAESHLVEIWDLMSVPLIQGTLRYARLMDEPSGVGRASERKASAKSIEETRTRRNAEGATFAAAILPRVWGCSPDDAKILYRNMRMGTTDTDFGTVKGVLEANYECLGVTCGDVGGLYDADTGSFFEGGEPCGGTASSSGRSAHTSSNKTAGEIAAIAFGAITMICLGSCAIGVFCNRRMATKEANPDAATSSIDPEGFSWDAEVQWEIDGVPGRAII